MNSSFIQIVISVFANSKLKKQIFLTTLMVLIFSGVVIAVPALEKIYGEKIFVNGIKVGTDPNQTSFTSDGGARVKWVGIDRPYDPNFQIKGNGFTVDPNGWVSVGNLNFGTVYGEPACGYTLGASGYLFRLTSGNSRINASSLLSLCNSDNTIVDISSTGLIMAAGKTITVGGLTFQAKSGALADDGTITLPTITSGGMLKVWTEAEYAEYFVKADGSVEYIRLSTNSDDIDNDGYLCTYDGGTSAVIKNRLGSSKTVNYVLEYN